jgi:hypothetical protein
MAAPSLSFLQTTTQAPIERDFAAEASLHRVRAAAMVARDRLAEIEGVRVLGPEVSRDAAAGVRLAIDVRDTGRDAWQVACNLASRGFQLDSASGRVIIVRLGEEDILDGVHARLAPALELSLWATPRPPAGGEVVPFVLS